MYSYSENVHDQSCLLTVLLCSEHRI
uniref:Uncharacterized protein n=1 Tax=Anguilla anguilla TaxID=7936 RepID=A0A0E9TUX3_ANGAN